jgi:hypothetical protein
MRAVPEPLRSVIAMAVERDPRRRYGSARAFAEALAPHGRGTASSLRGLILDLWPDADAEERAFLRGAFGDDVASPRSYEDETLRMVFPATVRGPVAMSLASVTPDGATIVRRPASSAPLSASSPPSSSPPRPATPPPAARPPRGGADDDADDTERMVVQPPAGPGARIPRGMFVSSPTGSKGQGPPSLAVALIPSEDGPTSRPPPPREVGVNEAADDDDDDTTIRTTTADLGAGPRRGVPLKQAHIDLVEPDDRTLRSLPDVDTEPASRPSGPPPVTPRKR